MSEKIKLNLRALKPSKDADTPKEKEKIAAPVIIEKEVVPVEIPVDSAKISLGGIKKGSSDVNEDSIIVENKKEDTDTKDSNEIAKISIRGIKKKSADEQENKSLTTKEESKNLIESKSSLKESIDGEENTTTIKKKDGEDKKVEFQNYESTFEKQSSNVLKRIQNFHYAPKTRVGFVLGLIFLLVITVGGLMISSPENHSFSVYKASLLEVYKNFEKEKPKKTDPGEEIKEIDVKQSEVNLGEKDNPNLANDDGETKNTIRDIEQEQKQREKLRQHLLKKYSSH